MEILNTYAPVIFNAEAPKEGKCLMYVLVDPVEGGSTLRKVYMGVCSFKDAEEGRAPVASLIVAKGTKATYAQAVAAFPNLKKEAYVA